MFFTEYISGNRRLAPEIESMQTDRDTLDDAASSVDVTITAVVKNKSFLFFMYRDVNSSDDSQDNFVSGKILNSTTLRFERVNTNGVISIEWFVVEFKSSTAANVQHISHSLASASDNVAITPVALGSAFPILTARQAGVTLAADDKWQADITSSSNLNLSVDTYPGFNAFLECQVVENGNWQVTRYADSIGAGAASKVTTITPVVLAHTFMTISGIIDGPYLGDDYHRSQITAVNQITTQRSGATGQVFSYVIYVVEGFGKFNVQHIADNIPIGSNFNDTIIAAVNLNWTILAHTMINHSKATNVTNNNANANNTYVRCHFNAANTVRANRAGNAVQVNYTLQAIDFTAGT